MSPRFPFDELLDAVRKDGVPVGPRERLAFARFLSHYDGTSREELRTAAAALLADSREEVEIIERAFDELYPEVDPPPPPSTPLPQPPPRSTRPPTPAPIAESPGAWRELWRWLRPRVRDLAIGLSALVLVVTAVIVPRCSGDGSGGTSTASSSSGETTTQSSSSTGTGATASSSTTGSGGGGGGRPPNDESKICPAPGEAALRRWPLPAGLLAIATLLALGAAGLAGGRRRRLAERQSELADRFLDLPGPGWYDADWDGDGPTRAALSRLASILERALRRKVASSELDADRTADATARAGLFPALVRRRRAGRARLVILQDTSAPSHPFHATMDSLVGALERANVELTRLFFDGDPSRVAAGRGAPSAPLHTFSAQLGGRPLVVLGTGEHVAVAAADPRAAEHLSLGAWPARVLIHPVIDRARWPRGLTSTEAPIAAFALDEAGVRAAARRLAGRPAHLASPASTSPALQSGDLHVLRAMVALAPQPSFEVAEALRRRFLPHAPREIVLGAAPLVEGRTSDTERGAVEASILEARRLGRFPEAEVRRFLRAALAAEEPADHASAAHLRWQRDIALQDLHAADEATRKRAQATLVELGRGPLGPELQAGLRDAIASGRRTGRPGAALLRVAGRVRRSGGLALGFALSSAATAWILALAALAAGTLAAAGSLSGRPLAIDGGRSLVWSDDDLRMGLCAFDRIYDVDLKTSPILGLASAPGHPLVAFKITPVIGSLRAMEARALETKEPFKDASLVNPSAEDPPPPSPDPIDPLQRQAELELPSVPLESKTVLIPFRADTLARGVNPSASRTEEPSERDAARCQRSLGVCPGTRDEVITRFADPGARLKSCRKQCELEEIPCHGDCVDDSTDPRNCGKCDNVCPAGTTCEQGECTCPNGATYCSGGCTDTRTDPKNCGACGVVCGTTPCTDGSCCSKGETACGKTCCKARANTVVSCDGDACLYACAGIYQDCNGTMNDGCESSSGTDDNNCGRCGVKCGPTESCYQKSCAPNALKVRAACTAECSSDLKACLPKCAKGNNGPAPAVAAQSEPACQVACDAEYTSCKNACSPKAK